MKLRTDKGAGKLRHYLMNLTKANNAHNNFFLLGPEYPKHYIDTPLPLTDAGHPLSQNNWGQRESKCPFGGSGELLCIESHLEIR